MSPNFNELLKKMLKKWMFSRNTLLQFFVGLCLGCSYPQSIALSNRYKCPHSLFCARDRGLRNLTPNARHRCQNLGPDCHDSLGTDTFPSKEQPLTIFPLKSQINQIPSKLYHIAVIPPTL